MAEIIKHYASMHMHSTHSDGVYTPKQLVDIAKKEGLSALSLTDHDTVTGNAEAKEACIAAGLDYVFGIEFSTYSAVNGKSIHVTAFDFDPEYPDMKDYLFKLSEKETDQTRVLFERGVDIGYIKNLTWDEVLEYNKGISWLCNEHVFRAMKAKGLITDLQYDDFFRTCYGKYRGQVPPKYEFKTTEEVIGLVHAAGGIAVAAHPSDSLDLIDGLAAEGLDGIEVWHSLLSAGKRREALKLALKNDLYVSGGEDHEGLLGGEYARYEHPEQTHFFFPEGTLGTTKYFFEEIRDKRKKPDRKEIMRELIDNDEFWQKTGGIIDNETEG